MKAPNILSKLRDADLLGKALGDILGLDEPPKPGKAVRCIRPENHKHGDAKPSMLVFKNGAGARCQVCNAGGGLLDLACAQLNLATRAEAAAELERRYVPGSSSRKHSKIGNLVATYEYTDELGNLLYEVCRFEQASANGSRSKTFRVRRPNPRQPGDYIWNLKGVRAVLFRLPRVLEAIENARTIYVVEGEKDALALESAGVVATCCHGGAGKWRKHHTVLLRGAKLVVIVADKDDPGYRHARDVFDAVAPVVAEIKTVEAKEGKDAADHLAANCTIEEFAPIELPEPTKPGRSTRDSEKKPEIEVTTDVVSVVNQAERAVLDSGEEIYQRGGLLVRVRRDLIRRGTCVVRARHAPVITPFSPPGLRELFSSAARWMRFDTQSGHLVPTLPPRWAVDVLAARVRWRVPPLEGVVEAPTLRTDGSVLDTPGYDSASGLLLEPNAEYGKVPTEPSRDDALAALNVLTAPFAEFPYVSDVDRAAALAAILTMIGRHAIPGPTPLFAVMAPSPGTGKSLLVFAIVTLATGRPPTTVAPSYEDEEFRKLLTTLALEGHAAVLFDNAVGTFGSAALAAALTSHEWSGRVLGVSRTSTAPLTCGWFVTGNNPTFYGDVYRRIIPIRLDAEVEQPEDREFKIADLLLHVRQERPRLLIAGLTVLRAFFHAGRPGHGKPRMGSFESWDDRVRSCVSWITGIDACAGRSVLREETDMERDTVRALFSALAKVYPKGKAFVSADLVRDAEHHEELKLALSALDRSGRVVPDPRVIGCALRKFRGKVYDQLRLVRADAVRQGTLWRIVALEAPPELCVRGHGGDGGDAPPSPKTAEPSAESADGGASGAPISGGPGDIRNLRNVRSGEGEDEDGTGGGLVEVEL